MGKPGHWKSLGASKEDERAPSWKGTVSPLRLCRGGAGRGVGGEGRVLKRSGDGAKGEGDSLGAVEVLCKSLGSNPRP